MAGKYHQSIFVPTNPEKYAGNRPPFYRSSWECRLMQMLDTHPSIIQWSSESIKIPYINPFTNKYSVYIPDFLVVYDDKDNKRKAEIIEIKPRKETHIGEAKSMRDKAAVALNSFKWKAATAWAQSHGMTFRVMTEDQIFHGSGKKKK